MDARTHVLVFDSDVDQLQTFCRGLAYLGFTCTPARAPAEALSLLCGPASERFDLWLVDSSAPGKAGTRLVVDARALRPGLPVLVVIGLSVPPDVTALRASGIGTLRMPFTPAQLGAAIERLLAPAAGPRP